MIRRRPLARTMVFALTGAAVLAAGAVGKTPLPANPQGAGSEPTAGRGVMGGAPIQPHYAIVEYDVPGGDLYVYLSPKRIGCGAVGYDKAPYVWVIVHTEGTPPRVGKPSLSNGRDIVQVNFTFKDHYVSATPGVKLVFTRVDPRKNAVWHGLLTVKKLMYKGQAYSYNGTFAARWCGSS
jgi:hypothetical protein